MNDRRSEQGFTLVESLISAVLVAVGFLAAGAVMVRSAEINRTQQQAVDIQSTTRNCMALVVEKLRSAGWNPLNALNLPVVDLDPDTSDEIDEITVYADLDANGVTAGPAEMVRIQHAGDRIDWIDVNTSPDPKTLGVNITNDADGDGVPEPMFTPDSTTNPTRITVKITGQSPLRDLQTGQFIRYTMTSEVLLRTGQWR